MFARGCGIGVHRHGSVARHRLHVCGHCNERCRKRNVAHIGDRRPCAAVGVRTGLRCGDSCKSSSRSGVERGTCARSCTGRLLHGLRSERCKRCGCLRDDRSQVFDWTVDECIKGIVHGRGNHARRQVAGCCVERSPCRGSATTGQCDAEKGERPPLEDCDDQLEGQGDVACSVGRLPHRRQGPDRPIEGHVLSIASLGCQGRRIPRANAHGRHRTSLIPAETLIQKQSTGNFPCRVQAPVARLCNVP